MVRRKTQNKMNAYLIFNNQQPKKSATARGALGRGGNFPALPDTHPRTHLAGAAWVGTMRGESPVLPGWEKGWTTFQPSTYFNCQETALLCHYDLIKLQQQEGGGQVLQNWQAG